MTTQRILSSSRKPPVAVQGPLRALQLIESVDTEPFHIMPIMLAYGSAVSASELMLSKVRWAERAEYTVLTRNVPSKFAPYNSIIRVSEKGTEDEKRDYLAHLVEEPTESAE